jgi:hypothetical protein
MGTGAYIPLEDTNTKATEKEHNLAIDEEWMEKRTLRGNDQKVVLVIVECKQHRSHIPALPYVLELLSPFCCPL